MKGSEEDQWNSNLPYDVLIQILCRLPIKTLISFKCVCKLWLNLISADNHLANLHHERAPTELLLRSSKKLYFGNIQFHNDPFSDFKLNVSERSNSFGCLYGYDVSNAFFSNTCNGFVCFTQRPSDCNLLPAFIWNPVSGEFISVHSPEFDTGEAFYAYGLGFSGKENRYKLLLLFFPSPSDNAFAMICTFEKGSSWRNLGDYCPSSYINIRYWPFSFLQGKLHFHYYAEPGRDGHIGCFDFDTERFGNVPIPTSSSGFDSRRCAITGMIKLMGELESSLSISQYAINSCFQVWVMKKYGTADSWAKMFSVNPLVSAHCFGMCSILTEERNGEILLCSQQKRLVLYDRVLNTTQSVGWDFTFLEVTAYSPTLVSLKDSLAGYVTRVGKLRFKVKT